MIRPAIQSASAHWVSARWHSTGGPGGRVGTRSFLIRSRFLAMRELATARISGVER